MEITMSRYEQLRSIERARVERENAYWTPLQEAAGSTVKAVEDYLELPSKAFELQGKAERYVSLGLYSAGDFETLRPFQLPGEDGLVPFNIAVAIETAPNAYPKRKVIINFEASYDDKDLFVSIQPGDEFEEHIQITGPESYQAVAEAVYGLIERSIDMQYAD